MNKEEVKFALTTPQTMGGFGYRLEVNGTCASGAGYPTPEAAMAAGARAKAAILAGREMDFWGPEAEAQKEQHQHGTIKL